MENKEETLNLEQGFNIILHAGNAKNLALEAITLAEENQIDASREKLEEANREVNDAHKEHKDLLDQLANGKVVQMDLILTHALDHLTSAEVICLVAQKFINLYEKR